MDKQAAKQLVCSSVPDSEEILEDYAAIGNIGFELSGYDR